MENTYLKFDSNKNLTHVTYYFANGEQSTVSVSNLSDEIKEFFISEHLKYQSASRKLRRYHSSLSLDELDEYLRLKSSHLDEQLIQTETHELFEAAMEKLLPEQKYIIHEIHFKKTSCVELAKKMNISKSAISHRHSRAKTALGKIIKTLDSNFNYDLVA